MPHQTLKSLLAGLMLLACVTAKAQPLQLQARTLDGEPFSMAQLKGKVVMLFFWSSDCVPCVQRMPELRANAAGWRGKAFALITVNLDRTRQPAVDYLKTVRAVEGSNSSIVPLWQGDVEAAPAWMRSVKPPYTGVIDVDGRVVSKFVGRVAPEAWDDVASLIP